MAGYRIDYTMLYQNKIGYQQIIIRPTVKYFIVLMIIIVTLRVKTEHIPKPTILTNIMIKKDVNFKSKKGSLCYTEGYNLPTSESLYNG